MILSQLITGLSVLVSVTADYSCLCNYNIEWSVLDKANDDADQIGSLYEFDCKPLVQKLDGWIAIAFENKLGYLKDSDQLQQQVCQGLPSPDDILTTTKKPLKTAPTTSSYSPKTTEPITSNSQLTTVSNITTVKYKTPKPPDYVSTRIFTVTPIAKQTNSRLQSIVPSLSGLHTTITSQQTLENSTDSTSIISLISTKRTMLNATSSLPKSSTIVQSTDFVSPTNMLLFNSTNYLPSKFRISTGATAKHTSYTSSTQLVTTQTRLSSISKSSAPIDSSMFLSQKSTGPTETTFTVLQANSLHPTKHVSTPRTLDFSLSSGIHTAISPDVLKGDISACPKLPGSMANVMSQFLDKCYEIIKSALSFKFAETHCTLRGGHLVNVRTVVVEEYLRQILLTWYNHPVWIGNTKVSGLSQWNSDYIMQYTNFHQPRIQTTPSFNKSCVTFQPNGPQGLSELHDCRERFSYICQYERLVQIPVGTTRLPLATYTDPIQKCRNKIGKYDITVQTDGFSCYKSFLTEYRHDTNPMKYCFNPQSICESLKGHLSRPSVKILNSLVPENELVIVPEHSNGQRRFLLEPPNQNCETLRRVSDRYVAVNNRQYGKVYVVCEYDM